MRYTIKHFNPQGKEISRGLAVKGGTLYHQSTAELLATHGMNLIRLVFTNGYATEVGPLEYECEWCGQYGHAIESCAGFAQADDPYDERDADG